MEDFGFRRPVGTSDLRRLDCTGEKDADFKKVLLRTHEEVAGLAREHDRFVRGVNTLVAEGNGSVAQSFPSVPQILGEIPSQSCFSGRPAVMLLSFLNPLLAVIALSASHPAIVISRQFACRDSRLGCPGTPGTFSANCPGLMPNLQLLLTSTLWAAQLLGWIRQCCLRAQTSDL
jgi:hypothetical protein